VHPHFPQRPVAVDLALVAVAGAMLVLTGLLALPDTISAVEEDVFRAVNDLPDALEWVLWPPMQFGAVLAVPVVALIAGLVWRRPRPVVAVLLAGAGNWVLARWVKEVVERGRPGAYFSDIHLRDPWIGGGSHEGLGFPSGHVAVAVSLATVLYPYMPHRWRWTVWALAGLVAVGRMFFGAHLPLDVLGGAALGLASGALTRLVLDLIARRRGERRAGTVQA
jgi:glycosyltransferase 2 family protein